MRLAPRTRLLGWSAFTVALLLLFALQIAPRYRFETDILALLPKNAADPDESRALDRFSDLLGRNAVWLIGDADFGRARAAAGRFAEILRNSPAFAKVRLGIDSEWPEQAAAGYLPYRDALLSERLRGELANGEREAVLAQAQQSLYSPAAFLRRSGPAADPLGLFSDFLAQATPGAGRTTLRDGVLVVESKAGDGRPAMSWVMVSAVLADGAFSTDEQRLAKPALEAAFAAAKSDGVQVAGSGLIQHSVAAAGLAREEVGLFGGIQLVGLVLILLWVFRSGRLLWLSAATLGVALVAALAVSHYVFGKLHVMTLVFCSNLAGIAIDYSIYYAADQFRAPGRWRPADAIHAIGPAIRMSCLAAVLSYALLAVAPFPGLRQMALFCCVGLAAAYGCVMGWFPSLLRPAPAAAAERLHARFSALQRWRERLVALPLWLPALLVAGFGVIGLARLQFSDDIRLLQPQTPVLYAQEQQVRALIGTVAESRFFMVRGASEQAVLETEEALRAKLDALVGAGHLSSYMAVSRALPSIARQEGNRALLGAQVYRADGLAPRFMRELGFGDEAIAQRLKAFDDARTPLTPAAWLATVGAEPFRHLWLGEIRRGHYASIVTIVGLSLDDRALMQATAAAVPGVRFVDQIAEISDVLRHYRERALLLVALAAVASGLLLAASYGLRDGFRLMTAPVAACLVTLAVFGYAGIEVTFFHVVALHLVTGLSMEYAILLMRPQWQGPSTLLSATLAALLAMLAFGLLAFSATPFIHSLGLTVTIGVACGFAFAFLGGTLPTAVPDGANPDEVSR